MTMKNLKYKPVVCSGLQPGSNTVVIGPHLQFLSDGTPIPPECQEYIWVPEILHKLHADKISTTINSESLPSVHRPLKLLKGIHKVAGDNFISALFMLSEY